MNDRIAFLWEQYLHDRCTEAEYWELVELLQQHPEASSELIDARLADADTDMHAISAEKKQVILSNIFNSKEKAPVKRIFPWKKWIAAAAVLLMATIASYFIFFNKSSDPQSLAQADRFRNDVKAPSNNRAWLTLADGRIIVLDSVSNGVIVANASKLNEEVIAYNNADIPVEYHTLSVPRGSRPMHLQLQDGSEVWLNVGSSIRYPTVFTGAERNVTITGEAYFEVAKNVKKKFIVSVNDMRVEVLGTHFNINAYEDEPVIRTTLLEGSVRVQSTVHSPQSAVLKPGEQSELNTKSLTLNINPSPDLTEVMAWKNGIFRFKGADINSVMRQLARWYDIDVKYIGKIPAGHFSGIINRNVNLSEVLRMLEQSDVKFMIDGKHLTVLE